MTTKFTGGTTPAYFSTQRPCEHEWELDCEDAGYAYHRAKVICTNDGCEASYALNEIYNILNEHAELKQENDNMIAEIAGMRDKWTPPDEAQELLDEIEQLREVITGCCYHRVEPIEGNQAI